MTKARKGKRYGHIAAEDTAALVEFYQQHLNPYLNFHRRCAVPDIVTSRRKGVYHINAADEVTQWQLMGAVPQISEAWPLPMLE